MDAAHFGPGQAHGGADFVLLVGLQIAEFLRPKEFGHGGFVEDGLVALLRFCLARALRIHHAARHLAADVADLALQIADAGLARVGLDQL